MSRDSPASRQIAIACIEHAFSIINSNEMQLRGHHEQEMEMFLKMYTDLGGTLSEQSLLNHRNETWTRNRSNIHTSTAPMEVRSSFKSAQSFKSFFSSSHLDDEEKYRGVDILLSEVL